MPWSWNTSTWSVPSSRSELSRLATALGRVPFLVAINHRLGGDDDRVARDRLQRLADHRFGSVDRRGVEQVDAEIDRLMDQPGGLVLGLAVRETEPAEAAAAEPRDADLDAGLAERGVLHCLAAFLSQQTDRPAADRFSHAS
jgi:hypothetical protein